MPEDPTAPHTGRPARSRADVPAPADVVWELLTSPEGVDAWLGEGSDLPPLEGADLDVADVETGVRRRGQVEEVRLGRRLGFVWWPADGDPADRGASRVVVELVPHDGGTSIEVTETPLAAGGAMRAVDSVAGTGVRSQLDAVWAWRLAALELRLMRMVGCVAALR